MMQRQGTTKYMQQLISSWDSKIQVYQNFLPEAGGETALAIEDEVVRLQAKIEEMRERLSDLEDNFKKKVRQTNTSKL